jgi:hypothetical protein
MRLAGMNSATKDRYPLAKKWRRAWDLNPRNFRLPVFKTGALGRYASPPWERLPEYGSGAKIEAVLRRADLRVVR